MSINSKRKLINLLIILPIISLFLAYCPLPRWLLSIVLTVMIVSIVAALILWVTIWKCPKCGKHLGKVSNKLYCEHCGCSLESYLKK